MLKISFDLNFKNFRGRGPPNHPTGDRLPGGLYLEPSSVKHRIHRSKKFTIPCTYCALLKTFFSFTSSVSFSWKHYPGINKGMRIATITEGSAQRENRMCTAVIILQAESMWSLLLFVGFFPAERSKHLCQKCTETRSLCQHSSSETRSSQIHERDKMLWRNIPF